MKKTPFLVALIFTFIIELMAGLLMIGRIGDIRQDTVLVNECVQSVNRNYGNTDMYSHALDYVVINDEGEVEYKHAGDGTDESSLSVTINEAVQNNDTILDTDYGKIIIRNSTIDKIDIYKNRLRNMLLVVSAIQLALILAYFIYLKKTVTDPFRKLNAFAARVADGNLDLPLERDRKNVFGAFTEAFDLMRSELKKARVAEKKAYDDKNEMVAQLSHDIKTPVASIKSTTEIGYEMTREERTREYFNQINIKTDQITTLVDNLFNSSVGDVTEIAVNPYQYGSEIIPELIANADYLNKVSSYTGVGSLRYGIPVCKIYADKLRLQQAFDNIFMNSYKYAATPVTVSAELEEEYLVIRIADEGSGVREEELPLLKNKFKRGSNIEGKDGAGLGLFLTDYYMTNMDGRLEIKNGNPGFAAVFYIRLV